MSDAPSAATRDPQRPDGRWLRPLPPCFPPTASLCPGRDLDLGCISVTPVPLSVFSSPENRCLLSKGGTYFEQKGKCGFLISHRGLRAGGHDPAPRPRPLPHLLHAGLRTHPAPSQEMPIPPETFPQHLTCAHLDPLREGVGRLLS